MPILNYKCSHCSKEFSKILVDPKKYPKYCPVCGAANPQEQGTTFNTESKSLERLLCLSCDSCSEESDCKPSSC
jgi:putative FmdB family regulatory protein